MHALNAVSLVQMPSGVQELGPIIAMQAVLALHALAESPLHAVGLIVGVALGVAVGVGVGVGVAVGVMVGVAVGVAVGVDVGVLVGVAVGVGVGLGPMVGWVAWVCCWSCFLKSLTWSLWLPSVLVWGARTLFMRK